MRSRIIAISVGVVLGATACSPLAPRPDDSKFFMLSPISTASSGISTASYSQLALGIGPISFPDYLRRLSVVTVTSPNQIDLSPDKYWGEPLEKNFSRVLEENLSELLNTQQIEKYPWAHNVHIDYQVTVDVQRFDTGADGQSQLIARWMVKDGTTGKDLYASETRCGAPAASGEAGPSAALSQNLATLSRDIASQIVQLSQLRSGTRADR